MDDYTQIISKKVDQGDAHPASVESSLIIFTEKDYT